MGSIMQLDTTGETLDWNTPLSPTDPVKEGYTRFLTGLERLLERAVETKRDIAVSTPRLTSDAEGFRLECRYTFMEPGALEDLPAGDRWTIYHTSTDQARALLAQVKQDKEK